MGNKCVNFCECIGTNKIDDANLELNRSADVKASIISGKIS